MLSIKGLKVKLEEEDKQILKGVDLEVEAGKVHAIMGPNGSGKSTLSYVLSGKDGYEVTEGSAHLADEIVCTRALIQLVGGHGSHSRFAQVWHYHADGASAQYGNGRNGPERRVYVRS